MRKTRWVPVCSSPRCTCTLFHLLDLLLFLHRYPYYSYFPNSVPPKNKDTLLHRVQSFLKETLQTFISLQLTVGISVISWPHIFLYKSIPFFSLIQYSVSDDVLILFNLFWPSFLRCNWHHYHKVSYTSISLLFCGFWWFISFHLWIIFYCLDVPQFVYSFINWSYLDCFQVLTAVNKAAIDFCM